MSFICLSTKAYKCAISNMHNLSIIQNNDKSTRTFHPTLKLTFFSFNEPNITYWVHYTFAKALTANFWLVLETYAHCHLNYFT